MNSNGHIKPSRRHNRRNPASLVPTKVHPDIHHVEVEKVKVPPVQHLDTAFVADEKEPHDQARGEVQQQHDR